MDVRDSAAGDAAGTNAASTSRSSTVPAAPSSTQPGSHEHSRVPSPERSPRGPVSADLQDATELGTVRPGTRDRSPSTICSGSVRVVTQQPSRSSAQTSSSREPTGRFAPIKKFWRRNVVLSVAQSQSRDHFGKGIFPSTFDLRILPRLKCHAFSSGLVLLNP